MANDRRFLYRGDPARAVGQVLDIGSTPTQLVASAMGWVNVRLQVLSGPNPAKAQDSDWADAAASNGRPLILSRRRPYILMTQPGTYRLNPADVYTLGEHARIWAEDATPYSPRIVHNSDTHGGYGGGASEPDNPAVGGGELIDMVALTFSGEAQVEVPPDLPVNTLPEYVSVEVAHDSETESVCYGYRENATKVLDRCDTLWLTRQEYTRMLFWSETETKLIVAFYTNELLTPIG